jgi:NAD(P)-dependent dehydrogenase (short-subunit alcohol dehydrogenase family)
MNGLKAFTQQTARELSPYGIRVHAVESDQNNIVENVLALLVE